MIILSCLVSSCGVEATDSEMINHFMENQEIFEAMVHADSDCHIDKKPGPTCKELMEELNISYIHPEPFIAGALVLDYKGFSSSNKGYLYSNNNEVTPLYNNLDRHPPDLGHYQKGHKAINSEWYIFYEYLN